MSPWVQFQRISAVLTVLVALLDSRSAAIAAEGTSADFAGPWHIRFSASVTPDPKEIKTDQGTTFSEYRLWFVDRIPFDVSKDGKLKCEHAQGTFQHRAEWKTAAGEAGDYRFGGSGVLKGNGQFVDGNLKLHLEWASGEGRGSSSGKPIATPVGAHGVKSDWVLKPVDPKVKPGSGKKLVFAGERSTAMPQQVGGCPPLQLVETVYVEQAPLTDLEVSVKDGPDPLPSDGKCTLSIEVKNLGPDESRQTLLRVILPLGVEEVAVGDKVRPRSGSNNILSLPLGRLAKGESKKVEVAFRRSGEIIPADKEALVSTLVQVSGEGHDPHFENNGAFASTTFQPKQ